MPEMVNIDRILKGSVDMHVHHGPSRMSSHFNPFDISKQAADCGMGGIVFKDTGYMNGAIALFINEQLKDTDFKAFGSIVLNNYTGGINKEAVESAWRFGASVVWMPTQSSENSMIKFRQMGIPVQGEGIRLVDKSGKLIDKMYGVLEVIKAHDMVLATGHISAEEDFAVIEAAREMGIEKIILTHPTCSELVMDSVPTIEETKKLVEMGAYAEFTYVFHLPTEFSYDPRLTAATIRDIGAEKCIISTDLGVFDRNVGPVEGFKMYLNTLAYVGMTEAEITAMAKTNPRKLLGMD